MVEIYGSWLHGLNLHHQRARLHVGVGGVGGMKSKAQQGYRVSGEVYAANKANWTARKADEDVGFPKRNRQTTFEGSGAVWCRNME